MFSVKCDGLLLFRTGRERGVGKRRRKKGARVEERESEKARRKETER